MVVLLVRDRKYGSSLTSGKLHNAVEFSMASRQKAINVEIKLSMESSWQLMTIILPLYSLQVQG